MSKCLVNVYPPHIGHSCSALFLGTFTMSLRQTTLSFAPRVRLPEVPGQGAAVQLVREQPAQPGPQPAIPMVAPNASDGVKKQRRGFTDDHKLEVIKVCLMATFFPSCGVCCTTVLQALQKRREDAYNVP